MPDEREEIIEQESAGVLVHPGSRTKAPSLYKVLVLNDDFTPRDFVVHILMRFFRKDEAEATRLMLEVHTKGVGCAGVFTYEIAETKAHLVNDYSRKNQYPLKCALEKE